MRGRRRTNEKKRVLNKIIIELTDILGLFSQLLCIRSRLIVTVILKSIGTNSHNRQNRAIYFLGADQLQDTRNVILKQRTSFWSYH